MLEPPKVNLPAINGNVKISALNDYAFNQTIQAFEKDFEAGYPFSPPKPIIQMPEPTGDTLVDIAAHAGRAALDQITPWYNELNTRIYEAFSEFVATGWWIQMAGGFVWLKKGYWVIGVKGRQIWYNAPETDKFTFNGEITLANARVLQQEIIKQRAWRQSNYDPGASIPALYNKIF
jgi:hypothetical protein